MAARRTLKQIVDSSESGKGDKQYSKHSTNRTKKESALPTPFADSGNDKKGPRCTRGLEVGGRLLSSRGGATAERGGFCG